VEAANEVLLVMAEEELNEAGHKVFEARGVAARAQHTISKIAHTGEIMFRDELYRQVKEKAEELDQREREILKLLLMHDETMQRDREQMHQQREELGQWGDELCQRGELQLCLLRVGLLFLTILMVHKWAQWLYDLYCDL
jgi:hypothetical protein